MEPYLQLALNLFLIDQVEILHLAQRQRVGLDCRQVPEGRFLARRLDFLEQFVEPFLPRIEDGLGVGELGQALGDPRQLLGVMLLLVLDYVNQSGARSLETLLLPYYLSEIILEPIVVGQVLQLAGSIIIKITLLFP